MMDDKPSVSMIWLCKKHFEISEKGLELAAAKEATDDDNDVLAKHIGV
jgi:hypothetical protein